MVEVAEKAYAADAATAQEVDVPTSDKNIEFEKPEAEKAEAPQHTTLWLNGFALHNDGKKVEIEATDTKPSGAETRRGGLIITLEGSANRRLTIAVVPADQEVEETKKLVEEAAEEEEARKLEDEADIAEEAITKEGEE
jgi:hypothetical protein